MYPQLILYQIDVSIFLYLYRNAASRVRQPTSHIQNLSKSVYKTGICTYLCTQIATHYMQHSYTRMQYFTRNNYNYCVHTCASIMAKILLHTYVIVLVPHPEFVSRPRAYKISANQRIKLAFVHRSQHITCSTHTHVCNISHVTIIIIAYIHVHQLWQKSSYIRKFTCF